MATIWISGLNLAARSTRRPIRPNPLIPTLMDIPYCDFVVEKKNNRCEQRTRNYNNGIFKGCKKYTSCHYATFFVYMDERYCFHHISSSIRQNLQLFFEDFISLLVHSTPTQHFPVCSIVSLRIPSIVSLVFK